MCFIFTAWTTYFLTPTLKWVLFFQSKKVAQTPLKVLVAPMSWGLGHATRCMPIIDELQQQGAVVLLASDGRAFQLLEKEYPDLTVLEFKTRPIHYHQKEGDFETTMFRQLPKIFANIYAEHEQLKQMVKTHAIDLVISDNRFGCWSSKIPSVFMTHQVFVQLPHKIKFLERPLFYLNAFFINRYQECWLPDYPNDENSLSGTLAHLAPLKNNKFHFVGALSRMKKQAMVVKKYDVVIILSGPEPQRTVFEKMLLAQLVHFKKNILLVRGVTETNEQTQLNDYVSIVDHLNAKKINAAILAADIVVSRAGYSTIMDLAVLGKKAILVPTPDQTEQEYLAFRFMDKGIFYSQRQEQFDLAEALEKVGDYTGLELPENNVLQQHISRVLSQ